MRRAVMLGIAGLSPILVKRWIADLPVMLKMRTEGVWANLSSTVPPLSPQAWVSAFSGRNPGAYGAWCSRVRSNHTYVLEEEVNSRILEERIRPLYRILPRLGQRVGVVNVPVTSPVPDIASGFCVGRPVGIQSDDSPQTWPEELAGEIRETVGNYVPRMTLPDGGRSGLDRRSLLENIREMDAQRFRLVKYFIEAKKCDIVMAVADGTELVSHLYLQDADPSHPYHDRSSTEKGALLDYYRWIDARIGDILAFLDEDTVLCLFSVSGIESLSGIFNLNEWLLERGYLHLKSKPSEPKPLEELDVDWTKTACWAMGGTGQLYVNLQGREDQGCISPDEYLPLLEKLSRELSEAVKAEVFFRNDVCFGPFSHLGPDLFLHFERGGWTTDQRVGHGRIQDTDSARESLREGSGGLGYLSIAGSDFPVEGDLSTLSVLDIAPTIIDVMNLRKPYSEMAYELEGYSLLLAMRDSPEVEKRGEDKDREVEDKVRSRLEALGY
jgi:predicted AlkP superfamily phosphohydrolase/phosphomutase